MATPPEKKTTSSPELTASTISSPTGDSVFKRYRYSHEFMNKCQDEIDSLFSAIKPGDPVDCTLKTMLSTVYKLDAVSEAINTINSHKKHFPPNSRNSMDHVLQHLRKVKTAKLKEAISSFDQAKQSGQPVDKALKEMVFAMISSGETEAAITAILDNLDRVSEQSLESFDNILIQHCKKAGRKDQYIKAIERNLERIEQGSIFGGKGTRVGRYEGKKVRITINHEKSRLLGRLGFMYLEMEDYSRAELLLREASTIDLNKNAACNLAICMMKHRPRLVEARALLDSVKNSPKELVGQTPYMREYDLARKILTELETQAVPDHPPH